ncbi:MAG: toll/interleukin-1 receptor domain-containing protein [Firmicutes bacterium]|nr:toll/interleukin-1 receptor domain-containing protein [Bacillota bacterium]
MSVFKCKMCGGTLEFQHGDTVAVCDSCGTKQTLPKLDDDRRMNLYDRANHFRRNNEFDKAMGIYEQILNEDKTDAEAYWSIVLCRYGIEYVEDPATHKRVPTVNRAQFTSIFDDDNYKSALHYADGAQRILYENEAKTINDIQKGIIAISQKEEPFDVFICYKETDKDGRRTQDSVLANDLYHQLTQEGFKVFFARITLEDKLGTAYEPYIFAALNSAKVMVVIGTKPEYFNAVWVRNEWSRYLALIKNGERKVLIPAYRDMDPYDLPEEFSHLQAQDMSKLGFMQDLIRGIKKLAAPEEKTTTVKETVVVNNGNVNIAPLLKRAFMFLEDGNFKEADEYCEKVLDQDPENAQAYLGKLMAEMVVRKQESLKDCADPTFRNSSNYEKVLRFGDEKLRNELRGYSKYIEERNENARKTGIYERAVNVMNSADKEKQYQTAIDLFKAIPGYKDSDEKIIECQNRIEELRAEAEAARVEKERRAEQARIKRQQQAKKMKKTAVIVTPVICVCIAFVVILNMFIIPKVKYDRFIKNLPNIEVGDTIEFGKYEQDGNKSNGKEDIEWIVIDINSDKALVISKYGLDSIKYNDVNEYITWEKSTIRKWLNNEFVEEAFGSSYDKIIASSEVVADKNPYYLTDQGNNTTDKIFLLSIVEVEKYFKSKEDKICKPTKYAISNGVIGDVRNKNCCCWWLRSLGQDNNKATDVYSYGEVDSIGWNVNNDYGAVRPAMWIKIK